jgi:hypothetical protein
MPFFSLLLHNLEIIIIFTLLHFLKNQKWKTQKNQNRGLKVQKYQNRGAKNAFNPILCLSYNV